VPPGPFGWKPCPPAPVFLGGGGGFFVFLPPPGGPPPSAPRAPPPKQQRPPKRFFFFVFSIFFFPCPSSKKGGPSRPLPPPARRVFFFWKNTLPDRLHGENLRQSGTDFFPKRRGRARPPSRSFGPGPLPGGSVGPLGQLRPFELNPGPQRWSPLGYSGPPRIESPDKSPSPRFVCFFFPPNDIKWPFPAPSSGFSLAVFFFFFFFFFFFKPLAPHRPPREFKGGRPNLGTSRAAPKKTPQKEHYPLKELSNRRPKPKFFFFVSIPAPPSPRVRFLGSRETPDFEFPPLAPKPCAVEPVSIMRLSHPRGWLDARGRSWPFTLAEWLPLMWDTCRARGHGLDAFAGPAAASFFNGAQLTSSRISPKYRAPRALPLGLDAAATAMARARKRRVGNPPASTRRRPPAAPLQDKQPQSEPDGASAYQGACRGAGRLPIAATNSMDRRGPCHGVTRSRGFCGRSSAAYEDRLDQHRPIRLGGSYLSMRGTKQWNRRPAPTFEAHRGKGRHDRGAGGGFLSRPRDRRRGICLSKDLDANTQTYRWRQTPSWSRNRTDRHACIDPDTVEKEQIAAARDKQKRDNEAAPPLPDA